MTISRSEEKFGDDSSYTTSTKPDSQLCSQLSDDDCANNPCSTSLISGWWIIPSLVFGIVAWIFIIRFVLSLAEH